MQKRLTVVIPAYNTEKYLEHCLQTLLSAERKQAAELIVVDDGSTDNTGQIAEQYAREYPELVTVIHKQNGGHGSAINTGIQHATGLYFRVVDSDDWVDTKAYDAFLEQIENLTCDLVVTPFVCVKNGKKEFREVEGLEKQTIQKRKYAFIYDSYRKVVTESSKEVHKNPKVEWEFRKSSKLLKELKSLFHSNKIWNSLWSIRDITSKRYCSKKEIVPSEQKEILEFQEYAQKLHVRMHEWTIRTAILKQQNITLSERCFYVDMQYILFPVPWIKTFCVVDEPVYCYRFGEEGQSVSFQNMQKNRMQHQAVEHSLIAFYEERAKQEDTKAVLQYLARGIAKMQANQIQTYLSMPIGRETKKELVACEQHLKEHCPRAYVANQKVSIRLLRKSNYTLYPVMAVAFRIWKRGKR